MPFFDQPIRRGIPYEINVDTSGAGIAVITILKLSRRGRLAVTTELFTVAGGAATTLTDVAGSRADRIILAVHPAGNATISVEVKQGPVALSQACFGDTDIVFDPVP